MNMRDLDLELFCCFVIVVDECSFIGVGVCFG